MRDYGSVCPSFWTGRTGRAIKEKGIEAQLVALYLMTCPSSAMTGLYYLPVPTLAHETGLPLEGASKALRSLSEVGFAAYDGVNEVVLVREMGRYQIAETIEPKDNRHKSILRDLKRYAHSPLFSEWFERYRVAFHLPADAAPAKPLPSPSEAPSGPLRSQEHGQGHGQGQEQKNLSGAPSAAPTGAPLELTPPKAKAARAKRPVAPKPAKPAAPFTAGEAVAALAASSGGRFVPADGTPWAPGWGANIARHVQAVPDLAVWTLVGEWIAAGGGYRGTRGMPWVAGGSFLDAVAQSKAWDEGGRYDLVDERGFPVAPPASCSDANDPWVIAAAKQGIKL